MIIVILVRVCFLVHDHDLEKLSHFHDRFGRIWVDTNYTNKLNRTGNDVQTEKTDDEQIAFVKQFTANHQRIFAFVVSLAPNWVEAEEVFQRVSVVIWKKWGSFDQEREFLPWALGIARLEVVKFMTERSRRKELLGADAQAVIPGFYRIVHAGFGEEQLAYVDRVHQWNGVDEQGLPSELLGGEYPCSLFSV